MKNDAIRVRKLKAEQGTVKVDQTVVQGDQITKTEIKDSVLNRSNVGSGSSKMQELKDLTEMKKVRLTFSQVNYPEFFIFKAIRKQ